VHLACRRLNSEDGTPRISFLHVHSGIMYVCTFLALASHSPAVCASAISTLAPRSPATRASATRSCQSSHVLRHIPLLVLLLLPLLMRLAATIRRPSSEAVHTEPVTRPSPSGGERAGIARLTMNPNYLVLADNARKKMRSSLTSAPAHHAAPPSCRRSSRSVDSTGTAPHADARDWQSTGVGGGSRAPCRARGGRTRSGASGHGGARAHTHAPAR